MTSDAYDGLPDWMTVGAQVLQVLNRRYYGAIVTSGRVHRVLARDVVVIDDEGVALTRFRLRSTGSRPRGMKSRSNSRQSARAAHCSHPT